MGIFSSKNLNEHLNQDIDSNANELNVMGFSFAI